MAKIKVKGKKKTESSHEDYKNLILDGMVKKLHKKMDNIAIWKMNDPNVPTLLKRVVPTNLPSFDIICARTPMGRTGLPISRQIEIAGPPESGKTSLCCHLVAVAQKRLGWNAIWLEHENKFDPKWAEKLGVDVENCIFSQPNTIEECIRFIDVVMDEMPTKDELPEGSKQFGTIIIVDSVAAMPTEAELGKDIEKNHVGVFQRKMSQAQRRITNKLSKRNVIIVWVNQERANISMNPYQSVGDPTTTYGGKALKYFCASRWSLYPQKPKEPKLKGKGRIINIVNKKNQCGFQPFLKTRVFMHYQKGFDYVYSWMNAMESLKMISRKGNKSITIRHGKHDGLEIPLNKVYSMYEENPTMFKELEQDMKERLGDYIDVDLENKKKKKAEESAED